VSVQPLSLSLPSTEVGTDWYYRQKRKNPLTDLAFGPTTDDSDVRPGEEPPAQTPGSAERYFTFREGGDTGYEGASISLDSDDEEDSTLDEESESTSNEDREASLQERLIEAEEGYLAQEIQQAIILDIRQNQVVVERSERRDSTLEPIVSVVGHPSAYAEAIITLKAVHPDLFLEGIVRA
jgi:hypothetical protein